MQERVRERDEADGYGFSSPCTWLVLKRRQRAPVIGRDKMETLRSSQHEEKKDGTFSMPGEGEQVLLLRGRLLLPGPWLRASLLSHTHASLLAAEQQQSYHHGEAFCPLAAQTGGPAGRWVKGLSTLLPLPFQVKVVHAFPCEKIFKILGLPTFNPMLHWTIDVPANLNAFPFGICKTWIFLCSFSPLPSMPPWRLSGKVFVTPHC